MRARLTDACARVDRARRSAHVGVSRFCVCVCVWPGTHALSVRGRTTRISRVNYFSLLAEEANKLDYTWLLPVVISRAHPIYSLNRWCGIANTAGLRGRKYSVLAQY